jgi:two-component system NarL family sensor kinase
VLVEEQQSAIRSAIADIRRLVYDLRPPALDELGLVGAIREQAAHYRGWPGKSLRQECPSGLSVEVQMPEEVPALPAALEVATYRIVQEALSNVARHAHARSCIIRLALSEGVLQVEITDDGIGLPAARRGGVGLLSMRERAEELGGTCQIEATPGGTRVCARLPMLTAA